MVVDGVKELSGFVWGDEKSHSREQDKEVREQEEEVREQEGEDREIEVEDEGDGNIQGERLKRKARP